MMDDIRTQIRNYVTNASSLVALPDTMTTEENWDTAARDFLNAATLCLVKAKECGTQVLATQSIISAATTPGTPVSKGE